MASRSTPPDKFSAIEGDAVLGSKAPGKTCCPKMGTLKVPSKVVGVVGVVDINFSAAAPPSNQASKQGRGT
jgi:hypothetical protein